MNTQVAGELSGFLAIFPIHSKDKTLCAYEEENVSEESFDLIWMR